MRKRYLSFSLWGQDPLYTIGTVRNAELANEIYSEWQMIVFHDDSVPSEILNQLNELGVELVHLSLHDIHPLFWRFYVLDREDCERAVFRDSDSRISKREKMAVDEWILEDTKLHIMRDHPFHEIPFGASKTGILGGMWGLKNLSINIQERIRQFTKSTKEQAYGIDQIFLESIYDEFFDSATVHDEFFIGKKFPIKRDHYRFVGERIDINEEPLGEDWKEIQIFEKNKKKNVFHFMKKIFNYK